MTSRIVVTLNDPLPGFQCQFILFKGQCLKTSFFIIDLQMCHILPPF